MTLRPSIILAFAALFMASVTLNMWQWHRAATRSLDAKLIARKIEDLNLEYAAKVDTVVITKTRIVEKERDAIQTEAQSDPTLQKPVDPDLDRALADSNRRMRAIADAND